MKLRRGRGGGALPGVGAREEGEGAACLDWTLLHFKALESRGIWVEGSQGVTYQSSERPGMHISMRRTSVGEL